MPLSTSNSKATLPRSSALLALVVVVVSVVAMEVFWRARGVEPSAANTPERWAREVKALAHDTSSTALAMVGSSRMQTGLDPALLKAQLGSSAVYNLSFEDNNPLPFLTLLADKTEFKGVVLVEGIPLRLFGPDAHSMAKAEQNVLAYERLTSADIINDALKQPLYSSFALFHDALKMRHILGHLLSKRHLPYVSASMRQDRLMRLDFTKADPHELAKIADKATASIKTYTWLDEAQLKARLDAYQRAIKTLQKRGAKVIFYRPVVHAQMLTKEETLYPSAQWWTPRIAPMADCAIDFRETPALAAIPCPDLGHTDQRQVPTHTQLWAQLLKQRCGL